MPTMATVMMSSMRVRPASECRFEVRGSRFKPASEARCKVRELSLWDKLSNLEP
jgi:hypothetical protein